MKNCGAAISQDLAGRLHQFEVRQRWLRRRVSAEAAILGAVQSDARDALRKLWPRQSNGEATRDAWEGIIAGVSEHNRELAARVRHFLEGSRLQLAPGQAGDDFESAYSRTLELFRERPSAVACIAADVNARAIRLLRYCLKQLGAHEATLGVHVLVALDALRCLETSMRELPLSFTHGDFQMVQAFAEALAPYRPCLRNWATQYLQVIGTSMMEAVQTSLSDTTDPAARQAVDESARQIQQHLHALVQEPSDAHFVAVGALLRGLAPHASAYAQLLEQGAGSAEIVVWQPTNVLSSLELPGRGH